MVNSQTKIGNESIPVGWDEKPIDDIAFVIGGGTPSTFNIRYWNGNINWFTPSEIGISKYVDESKRKISSEGLENSSAKRLPAGTILLTTRATIGEVSILLNEATTNQGFQNLLVKDGNNNEFVYYAIQTKKGELFQNASGSTFLEISPGKLKAIKILIPPPTEQTAIATALNDADALISKLEALLEKKRMIKMGAMRELLSGTTRVEGSEGHWVNIQLKSIIEQFIVPMRDKPKKFNGKIPWCRIEDFNGKYLFDSKSGQYVDDVTIRDMNLKIIPVDAVIVSCSADLGRCAIIKKPLITNQTFIGLVVNDSLASNEFLYYYMTFNSEKLNQLSSGTTISYLSREQFESFKIFIPESKNEQVKIAKVLSSIDSDIDCLEKQIEKYKLIKQGMMQSLLTGKIRLV